jgi:microcystin-dependent protein
MAEPFLGEIGTFAYGGSAPHNTMQPYLSLNACIALTGIFPARS